MKRSSTDIQKEDSHLNSNLGYSQIKRNHILKLQKSNFAILILISLTILACSFSTYELKNEVGLHFRNLFGKHLKQGLVLDKNPRGGMVEGIYRDAQGQKIEFLAGEAGYANLLLFTANHAPPMVLHVGSVDTAEAYMDYNYIDSHGNWKDVTMDGIGALSDEEQSAMADLMNNQLVESLLLLPLDLACQGEEQVSPVQLAALLYPVQMLYKYQITDRAAMTEKLMPLSQCDYGIQENGADTYPSEIIITLANPVPVVLGHFPFDPEGAVEASTTGAGGAKIACLDSSFWPAYAETGDLWTVDGLPASDSIIGQYGPCEAKCRGACGSDCTLNNCTLETEDRCEKDENGENTGSWSMFHKYTCGLHPACIKHDACYDDCNRRYGCGTWAATFCKHSVTIVTAPFEYFTGSFLSCDSTTLIEENPANVKDWVRGYGPKTETQVFEYRDQQYRWIRDTYECPTRAAEAEESDIVVQDEPSPEDEAEPILDAPEEPNPVTNPVSHYHGETGLWGVFEPLVVREDQFTMTVDEEGNVSGLFWYDYLTTIENIEMNDGNVCTTQYHLAANISISGQLVDDKGTVSAEFVPTICKHIGTCSANIGCGGGGLTAYIEIINGKLEGRWIFDDYPDLILPFTGTKQ